MMQTDANKRKRHRFLDKEQSVSTFREIKQKKVYIPPLTSSHNKGDGLL
jgi:hypothetical protein